MNDYTIKRAIIKTMVHAAKDALDFHEEHDANKYKAGELSLVEYCNRLACIGHDQAKLGWIIENMDALSTESLENIMGLK